MSNLNKALQTIETFFDNYRGTKAEHRAIEAALRDISSGIAALESQIVDLRENSPKAPIT